MMKIAVVVAFMFVVLAGYVSSEDDCNTPPGCPSACLDDYDPIEGTDDNNNHKTFSNCCYMYVENECNCGSWKSESCPEKNNGD